MLLFCSVLFALASHCALVFAEGYEGYKIFDVTPENLKESDLLHELSEQDPDYDFFTLTRIPEKPARVMVPPEKQDQFFRFLNKTGLHFQIINPNVGRTIEKESRTLKELSSPDEGLSTDRYHSHEAISSYLDTLAEKYPSRIFVETVGNSYENRALKTIRITNGDGRQNKSVIFVDGGFHAREWISPATAVYLITELSENEEEYADLLEDFDWIILPVVNADGYEFTRSSSNNRMWRKTRRPSDRKCIGTDPNRNWDFHWNEKGASSNPCSETYAGPSAFSDRETQAVRDVLLSLKGRGKMYLTLHSYGSLLLYPWGWTYDLPEDWEDLDEVAKVGQEAIQSATGTEYTVGSSSTTIYVAAGGSDDYAYAMGEFPIAITMELPAGGWTGFDPPPEDIDFYCKESWIGIKAMAKRVIQKYPFEGV